MEIIIFIIILMSFNLFAAELTKEQIDIMELRKQNIELQQQLMICTMPNLEKARQDLEIKLKEAKESKPKEEKKE